MERLEERKRDEVKRRRRYRHAKREREELKGDTQRERENGRKTKKD